MWKYMLNMWINAICCFNLNIIRLTYDVFYVFMCYKEVYNDKNWLVFKFNQHNLFYFNINSYNMHDVTIMYTLCVFLDNRTPIYFSS